MRKNYYLAYEPPGKPSGPPVPAWQEIIPAGNNGELPLFVKPSQYGKPEPSRNLVGSDLK